MSTINRNRVFRPRVRALFRGVPLFSMILGIALGGAAWVGGQPGFAIFAVLLMLSLAVGLVLAAPHSETVDKLLNGGDERISAIDRDASNIAGTVVIWAVIIGFGYELVTKGNAAPYTWLGAVGGVTYVVALVSLRIRR